MKLTKKKVLLASHDRKPGLIEHFVKRLDNTGADSKYFLPLFPKLSGAKAKVNVFVGSQEKNYRV